MAAFTLRQLRYFLAVVESGSVAEASRRVHIAQPSISTAIKSLEAAFDVQLFIRHHAHGLRMTPAGMRFRDRAQRLLAASRAFEDGVLEDGGDETGRITVGCFETVAPLYLPRMIAGLRNEAPGIDVRLVDGEQNDLLAGLRSGILDVAIVYRRDLPDDVDTVTVQASRRPYVLLPERHRLSGRAALHLREVADEPLILLDVHPSRHYFLGLFREVGVEPVVGHRSPSIEMVRGMVGQGFGYSLLVTRPWSAFTYDGCRVIDIPVADDVTGSELVAVWSRHAEPSRPAARFIAYCQAQAAAQY